MRLSAKLKSLALNHRVEIITLAVVLPIVSAALLWSARRDGGWPGGLFSASIRHRDTGVVLTTGATPREALESAIADLRRRWIRHILQVGPGAPRSAPEETEAELKQAMETRLLGANMDQMDLSGADLRGGHLREVSGLGTNFEGAQCAFVHFEKSRLTRARFDGADLSEAVLTSSDLRGATFLNARLVGADLSNTMLAGCDFSGADLSGATFDGAEMHGVTWDSATKFTDTDLSGASFLPDEAREIAAAGGARLPGATPAHAAAGAES